MLFQEQCRPAAQKSEIITFCSCGTKIISTTGAFTTYSLFAIAYYEYTITSYKPSGRTKSPCVVETRVECND